ncbi:M50 family metallopeptidase [Fictibacillus sp. b24]|uniref:M50 family metallopeptidase n=1 Tax=unclassified Fictibacillus TaxID=2644029 RepID=UPI0025A213F4|nr:M50 family metallopeptidase [Fictibacillus sp. b24]MDM5315715.1 M50 family metallopeptidase [Fictibacillus sp. b24]
MIKLIFEFIRKIKINPFFWIVIFGAVYTGHFREIIIWFFVVLIHEMGHFAGARLFKWRVSRIDLLPFGGAAVVEEHGTRPFHEEIWVAVLGPLQHVWLIGIAYALRQGEIISADDFYWFFLLNVTLFIFNLLPIWPLDGGKVAFALFAKWIPFKEAQRIFLLVSGGLLIIGSAWQLSIQPTHLNLWVISTFLGLAHVLEWRSRHYVFMRFLLSRVQQTSSRTTRTIIVPPTWPLSKVTHQLMKGVTHYIVIKNLKPIKIKEAELLDAYFHKHPPECAIGKVFR